MFGEDKADLISVVSLGLFAVCFYISAQYNMLTTNTHAGWLLTTPQAYLDTRVACTRYPVGYVELDN